jgi:signal transduction histidine kinase
VVLSIDSTPEGWVVTMRDDGRGFPDLPPSVISLAGHYGLSIMRERAETFGGSLIIQSVENAGTSLILTVPNSATPRR